MYYTTTTLAAIMVFILASPRGLVNAQNKTVEVDLFFPRDGGRYNASEDGIPIIVGVQNSPVAFEYGWTVWWDLYLGPPPANRFFGDKSGALTASIGAPAPATNPFVAVNTTGYLKPGNYTLQWTFGVQPWCEFLYGSPTNYSNTWEISRAVASGSLQFRILDNAMSPQLEDGCPSMLGVVSYASTTSWTFAATTVTIDPSLGPATYAAETSACVVTEPATFTPGSCGVSLDAAVKTSVSEMMGWTIAATSTTPPSSTTSTTSSPGSTTSSATSTTQTSQLKMFLSISLIGTMLVFYT